MQKVDQIGLTSVVHRTIVAEAGAKAGRELFILLCVRCGINAPKRGRKRNNWKCGLRHQTHGQWLEDAEHQLQMEYKDHPRVAKKNLVFSSGYGYPPTYLRAFLKSISRNMKTADVVLFYHDTSERCLSQLREYLSTVLVVKPKDHLVRRAIGLLPRRGRGLTSHLVHYLAPSLIGATSRIQCARYFWVKSYCDLVDITQYERIMLCDSRDVIVQSDAFDMVDGIGFITGAEERRIGECPGHQYWIYSHYGRHTLKELWDEWVVCSGVSLGPWEMVLEYVHAMTEEFNRCIDGLTRPAGGDQVVHNYLIRTKELNFPVHVSKNSEGIIGSLFGYDPKCIVLDEDGSISLKNGVTPCIIHHYDRFPKLRQHYSKFLSFDKQGGTETVLHGSITSASRTDILRTNADVRFGSKADIR